MRLLRGAVSSAVAVGLSMFGHALIGVLYASGAVPASRRGGTATCADGSSAALEGGRRGWRRLRVPRGERSGGGQRR